MLYELVAEMEYIKCIDPIERPENIEEDNMSTPLTPTALIWPLGTPDIEEYMPPIVGTLVDLKSEYEFDTVVDSRIWE
jgi:hypothetical protein